MAVRFLATLFWRVTSPAASKVGMTLGYAFARSPAGFAAQARKALSLRLAVAGVMGDMPPKWGAGGVCQLGGTRSICGPISAVLDPLH